MKDIYIYTGRLEENIPVAVRKAADEFFEGKPRLRAANDNGITDTSLKKELDEFRKCKYKFTDLDHMCRAGRHISGETVYCSAFIDTRSDRKECPFFKTFDQFESEFNKTNRKDWTL